MAAKKTMKAGGSSKSEAIRKAPPKTIGQKVGRTGPLTAKPTLQQTIDAQIRANQAPGKKGGAAAGSVTAAQAAAIGKGVLPTKASAISGAPASGPAAALGPGAIDPDTGLPVGVIPTDNDWLAGDSTYQDTVSSLNRNLSDTLTDVQAQKKTYDTTYNDDLRQLGYVPGGGWNTADPLTQSGKAFSGQSNDFAARGMLQSSGYGDALTNTTRQFNNQLSDATTARDTYDKGQDAYAATQQAQTNDAITQAKRAAIARKSAQYAVAASGVLT
jgi:hypothetical protein